MSVRSISDEWKNKGFHIMSFIDHSKSKFEKYFKCSLVCKTLETVSIPTRFECMPRTFIITIPFYITARIPTYFLYSEDFKSSEYYKPFLKKFESPHSWSRRCMDLTNFQHVHFNDYILRSIDDVELIKKMDAEFGCIVDCLFRPQLFEEFLVQNQINIGTPGFRLNRSKCNINFTLQLINFRKKIELGYDAAHTFSLNGTEIPEYNYIEHVVDVHPRTLINSRESITSFVNVCDNFWKCLDIVDDALYSYYIGGFDIEIGYKDLATSVKYEKVNAPPPVEDCIIQCIVFKVQQLNKSYVIGTDSIFIFLYIQNINSTKQNISKEIESTLHKLGLRCDNVFAYSKEYNMLIDVIFFANALDVIFGYNSFNFDWPYIVARYNYLNPQGIFNLYSIDHVALFRNNFMFSIKSCNSIRISHRCSVCFKKQYFSKSKSRDTTYNGDSTLKKNFTACNCSMLNTPSFDVKVIDKASCGVEIGSLNFQANQFPFTIHRDLILEKTICEKLPNKKLETAALFNFKQRVKSVQPSTYNLCDHDTRHVIVELAQCITLDKLLHGFDYLISTINTYLFSIEECSNQTFIHSKFKFCALGIQPRNASHFAAIESKIHCAQTIYGTCENNLNILWFKDKRDFLLRHDQFCKDLMSREFSLFYMLQGDFEQLQCDQISKDLYISVGKTSEQSLHQQMNWSCVEDVVNTVSYCCIDVVLTFHLETLFKLNMDLHGSEVMKLPPFNIFNTSAGRKSSFLVNYSLYPDYAICVTKSFKPYIILNAVMEAEQCEKSNAQNSNIIELECSGSINNIIFGAKNSNTECFNINEYQVGLPAESDSSNIENFSSFK